MTDIDFQHAFEALTTMELVELREMLKQIINNRAAERSYT